MTRTSIRIAVAMLLLCGAWGSAQAEPIRTPGRFGLGLGSGTLANGLSAKYFMAGSALQFNLGTFGGRGWGHRWDRFHGLGLGVDYLIELPVLARAGDAFELAWNFGGGLGLGFDDRIDKDDDFDDDDEIAVAAAFVLGLEFNFIPIPIDIVLEWRPGILLTPFVDLDVIDFTGHIRVYF